MTLGSTKLEDQARKEIDKKLEAAGWVIQDKNCLNLYESLGVAVCEMDTETGPADYILFVNGEACCIIEAKREGADLGGVAEQSQRYATSKLKYIQRAAANDQPLPFLYEATNHEIRFRDERDPQPRSRNVFHFHTPETLKNWLDEGRSLRDRLLGLPELDITSLRDCQIDAIHGIPGKSRFDLVDCVGVTETDKTELTGACKTSMLESFDLPPVFIGQSTIKAVA